MSRHRRGPWHRLLIWLGRRGWLAVVAVAAVATVAGQADAQPPAGPIVAVVDSGITPTLPIFRGRLVAGVSLTGTPVGQDVVGHGTEMSSIVASYCPRCRIMPVKVLDGNGGWGSPADIAAGISWAAAHGASVINVSIGMGSDDAAVDEAIRSAFAAGITVVVAAGNSGPWVVTYPAAATYDVAITVGAYNYAVGRVANWSGQGGRVDLAAPSTVSGWSQFGKRIQVVGTSPAAAYTSAMAGNLMPLSPADVLRTLVTGAVKATGVADACSCYLPAPGAVR